MFKNPYWTLSGCTASFSAGMFVTAKHKRALSKVKKKNETKVFLIAKEMMKKWN